MKEIIKVRLDFTGKVALVASIHFAIWQIRFSTFLLTRQSVQTRTQTNENFSFLKSSVPIYSSCRSRTNL